MCAGTGARYPRDSAKYSRKGFCVSNYSRTVDESGYRYPCGEFSGHCPKCRVRARSYAFQFRAARLYSQGNWNGRRGATYGGGSFYGGAWFLGVMGYLVLSTHSRALSCCYRRASSCASDYGAIGILGGVYRYLDYGDCHPRYECKELCYRLSGLGRTIFCTKQSSRDRGSSSRFSVQASLSMVSSCGELSIRAGLPRCRCDARSSKYGDYSNDSYRSRVRSPSRHHVSTSVGRV